LFDGAGLPVLVDDGRTPALLYDAGVLGLTVGDEAPAADSPGGGAMRLGLQLDRLASVGAVEAKPR
jgi:hypothetical protein